MSRSHPTGLGEPKLVGKKALFQPPKQRSIPKKSKPIPKYKVTKPPQRIRMTMDITKDAMAILQDIRHRHRLTTGKALPLWKIVSQAIEQYGGRKNETGD
jgi:hypothetical protein